MSAPQYGLLGRTLGHSYSPQIHKLLYCPDYALFEVEPEGVSEFLQKPCFAGINVTIPYKKTVMPLCHSLTDQAREIGSVNTILATPNGLVGHNTDAGGFMAMVKRSGISLSGKKVLIFGSGGAHAAAQYGARLMGAREIVTVSRSGENNYVNLSRHYDGQVLINTTPLGMYPNTEGQIADLSLFPKCQGVLDLIYNPRRTDLLLQAGDLGVKYSDGLPMLVAQARLAEEFFLNRSIGEEEDERILSLLGRDSRNIVLIGMPGCGKSTVGAALSALTGREAVDIDEMVEKAAAMSIPQLFQTRGEEAFRKLEHEQLCLACRKTGRIIITGGGAVTREENYKPLARNGRIYHLLRPLADLPVDGRPLSQGADLEQMYKTRLPMYRRFRDVEISNLGPAEDTAQAIWRDYIENSGH